MERIVTLYHGSQRVVAEPFPKGGNPHNDYGQGLYCTESAELAMEWACTDRERCYVNTYSLHTPNLRIMNLGGEEYHILNWLAILLENRKFSTPQGLPSLAKKYVLDTFLPDYSGYDVIVGYRADDSYFSFASAFLAGTISLEQLSRAMHLGNLGEQIVLKTLKAFGSLHFEEATPVDYATYHRSREERDVRARADFHRMKEEKDIASGVYIIDILRQNWKNDDPCLR